MSEPHSSTSSITTATEALEQDVEAVGKTPQTKASHWQLVVDQIHVTPEVLNWPYKGAGTAEDPYVVEFIENDRRDPMLFSQWKKWGLTILVSIVSLYFP